MTRRKATTKKPDAILTADWHIRPDTPECRTDDYFAAMERKIDFILELSKEYDCPILIAGDIGNKPGDKENKVNDNSWPPWLLRWAISKFEGHEIIVIPGQHDLPNHQLNLWERSGVGVLHAAGAIELIGTEAHFPIASHFETFGIIPFPYGIPIKSFDWDKYKKPDILIISMTHQPVIENKPRWPDDNAPVGHSLLKQFPEYQLILTGDNHIPFVAEYEGRILVNPGSIMRNTADQEDHKPRVYVWYSEENTAVPVYLPIEQNVITRKHIDFAQARDQRFDAFVTRVKQDIEIQLSYENNLEKYFKKYRTEKPVVEKTWAMVK